KRCFEHIFLHADAVGVRQLCGTIQRSEVRSRKSEVFIFHLPSSIFDLLHLRADLLRSGTDEQTHAGKLAVRHAAIGLVAAEARPSQNSDLALQSPRPAAF